MPFKTGPVELGELTGIVTHQFNNILNDIVLQLAVLERGNIPPEARAEVTAIRQRSQQAAGMVKELQRYGRSAHTALGPVDLNATVRDVTGELCGLDLDQAGPWEWALPNRKRLMLHCELAPALPAILGSAPDVMRLLDLLLESAAAVLPGNGEAIVIRTRLGELGPQLLVEDGGPKVAAEMLPRLFEPFTVARPGNDGLALPVCRGLARRMQATLRGDNRADEGMVFTAGFSLARK
jgi:signal transduction histidine kinase